MSADWDAYPYPSQRMPVMARNVVATSQPLAASAGLRMLYRGGNAVDAAIAAAIALTVVEPTSNGIGGDAFAFVWDGAELHGLNASGRSPRALHTDRLDGYSEFPLRGWLTVTVPGAVSAWTELHRRFGSLPFGDLFEPAIDYAEGGFMVPPVTSQVWAEAERTFAAFPEFIEAFLPGGRAPRAGEIFSFPEQAWTLRRIADSQGEDFYRGEIARKIVGHAVASGGMIREEDLHEHAPEWVDPLSVAYGGLEVAELPPNGQGLAASLALAILNHHDVGSAPVDSVASLHLQIEAMKLAFADTYAHVADPSHMVARTEDLLSPSYVRSLARRIRPDYALAPGSGSIPEGGTVYLATGDAEGRMVSFIQSNYREFGSGIVVPGTGITLQNRGAGFSLVPGHPNLVGPSKRPFHTIIPGFATSGDQPNTSFGVMGGPMQPQGHVQLVVRMETYGQNPQAAIDAPRWQVREDGSVLVEPGVARSVIRGLRELGHRVRVRTDDERFSFGGAQVVRRAPGGYVAASDPRKDGQAVGC